MKYAEYKRKWWEIWRSKFTYWFDEAFGSGTIKSSFKLAPTTLDEIASNLLRIGKKTKGRVANKNISYFYTPRSVWIPEDPKDEGQYVEEKKEDKE